MEPRSNAADVPAEPLEPGESAAAQATSLAGESARARESANVVRTAGVASVGVMASRVTGLLREVVLARWFGASPAMEAFRLGFQLPNLARDLFAEGALSSAFVPTFTEYLVSKSRAEAARLANLVTTAVVLIVGAICLLGVLAAPQLVGLFAPGFAQSPGKHELAVHLTRIMFPFLLLVALAAQAMGILNACNQFAVPAISSSLFNITSVAAGVIFGFWMGPSLGIEPIEGMAWGVIVGGVLQLGWQMPSLVKSGFRFGMGFDWRHPGLQRIIRLMGPAVLGAATLQINTLVNTVFASYLNDPVRGPNGPISWLGWAFRLMAVPMGLFGAAVASAALPALSRAITSGTQDDVRHMVARSLGVVLMMCVPSSIGLVVLGRPIIAAIYEGGQFDAYDTQQTAVALSCYAVGLTGYAGGKVLVPAFYALKDARTPMAISLLSILVNYVAVSSALRWGGLGHAGLALATSTVSLFSFVGLFGILRNRIGGIYGRELFSSTVRIGMASLAMGSVVASVAMGMEKWLGTSQWASVATLCVCLPTGLALFYGAAKLLKVPELDVATTAFAGPLSRLVRKGRVTLT